MQRLKTLFVTVWYPTKEQPLEGVFVRDYAKTVQVSGDVEVLHCVGPDPNISRLFRLEKETDLDLTGGIPTYRVWYRPVPIPKLWYAIYLWSILQAYRQIVSHGFHPEIIHAHIYEAGVPAVLIGKLFKLPVVVTEHTSAFLKKRIRGLGAWTARFALEEADMVLPVSKSLQKAIEAYGIRARFQVVPNVVDISLFKPGSSTRSENGIKRLLCVGLLNPSHIKGVPYLLKALALLQECREDWHLDIVGDGPARADYERLKSELALGDRVIFHGAKTKEDVAGFMRQADLFVLPSLFETFSLATAEALAVGTPVLATHCGGPEEFITDEVGLLVPPGNITALRTGLDFMLDHLENYSDERISSYARQQFSPEIVGDTLHRVYLDCLPCHKS